MIWMRALTGCMYDRPNPQSRFPVPSPCFSSAVGSLRSSTQARAGCFPFPARVRNSSSLISRSPRPEADSPAALV
ncbi:MAG: hypothetical protein DMF50_02105 [Acidobacteria bacterium]|nr:MAG: hypothetical protein DMF50_02105 [Acidobacteriota bacterium]